MARERYCAVEAEVAAWLSTHTDKLTDDGRRRLVRHGHLPETTPLYFLAGADIFDGLTWLRFAFHEGQTIYKQNYGAVKLGVVAPPHVVDGRCWNNNYYYMKEMELEMRRFLNGRDFACFSYHRDLFRNALESAIEAIGA
jgi:hypothetical protein